MTGVIIGRFQVPRLHLGHIHLITTALQECDHVMILLGYQPQIDARNPFSLEDRRKVIQKIFPQVEVRAVKDHPGDDIRWSSEVDETCQLLHNPILYHSRDSFKGHYVGKVPTKEVPEVPGYSGTQVRAERDAMNLFQIGDFILHSGQMSNFKIVCDYLTDRDWEALAKEIHKRVRFKAVYGVPTGGLKLAKALEKYIEIDPDLPHLVVDDVLTTGGSMLKFAESLNIDKVWDVKGFAVFARGKCPIWVDALFKMY